MEVPMRIAHKVGILIAAIVLMLLALLLPRAGHADQSATFGDITVRYSAISTDQLLADVAKRYGIARSPRNGLVNIAIEQKSGDAEPAMIAATVSGNVGEITGHPRPIRFRETRDEGAVDYLGEFAIDAAGTYVFTINVTPAGRSQPYTVKFNRDYVLD
jgi:hypothetical protein